MRKFLIVVLLLNAFVWRPLANDVIPGVFSFDPKGLVATVRMANTDDHSFDGVENRRIYEYSSQNNDKIKLTLRMRAMAPTAGNDGRDLKKDLNSYILPM